MGEFLPRMPVWCQFDMAVILVLVFQVLIYYAIALCESIQSPQCLECCFLMLSPDHFPLFKHWLLNFTSVKVVYTQLLLSCDKFDFFVKLSFKAFHFIFHQIHLEKSRKRGHSPEEILALLKRIV